MCVSLRNTTLSCLTVGDLNRWLLPCHPSFNSPAACARGPPKILSLRNFASFLEWEGSADGTRPTAVPVVILQFRWVRRLWSTFLVSFGSISSAEPPVPVCRRRCPSLSSAGGRRRGGGKRGVHPPPDRGQRRRRRPPLGISRDSVGTWGSPAAAAAALHPLQLSLQSPLTITVTSAAVDKARPPLPLVPPRPPPIARGRPYLRPPPPPPLEGRLSFLPGCPVRSECGLGGGGVGGGLADGLVKEPYFTGADRIGVHSRDDGSDAGRGCRPEPSLGCSPGRGMGIRVGEGT